ncbi:MAG: diguanylate cyclase [Acidobacteriaceae bacterium]|nr:diguanylate cyclase [Acidobacteriaceae bacterium]
MRVQIPIVLQNESLHFKAPVFVVRRQLLGNEEEARHDSVLDAAFEVMNESDVPTFIRDASKYLVFLYTGIPELRFVVSTLRQRFVIHMRSGTICFVPSHLFVRCRWLGSAKMLVLVAKGSKLESLARDQHLPEIDLDQCYVIQEIQAVTLGHLVIGKLRNSSQNPLYLEALLRAFFMHLMSQLTRGNAAPDDISLSYQNFNEITQYVQENLADNLSVEMLARLIGLGERQFRRKFRATTGTSPNQWIIQRRLETAAVLLKDTDQTIGEIASQTGFSDQSHFTRNFTRYFRKTPTLHRSFLKSSQPGELLLSDGKPATDESYAETNTVEQNAADTSEIDFQLLSEANADVICLIGLDWTIYYTSPSSRQVLGWDPQEMNGRNGAEFIMDEDLPFAEDFFRERVNDGATTLFVCIRMRKKDGTYVFMEIHARILDDESRNEDAKVLLTMRDITQRKEREQELERLAYIDEVTGLPNFRSFAALLDEHWKKAVDSKSELSLILLNVDHFKEYNERYGAARGDRCLSAIADSVCKIVDRSFVARLAVDAIAVVLPDANSKQAALVAEQIRASVARLNLERRGSDSPVVTVSVGYTTSDQQSRWAINSSNKLIQRCQMAMIDAKLSGRNCVSTLDRDEMSQSKPNQSELATDLQG